RIEDDLAKLVDPMTCQSPVANVFRTSSLAEDGRVHVALPELVVKWKPAQYFRERLVHPQCELRQPIPGFFRDSEHSEFGFVAAAGPAIPGRGRISDVSLLDMAPTFLRAMGERQTARMDGREIAAMSGQ